MKRRILAVLLALAAASAAFLWPVCAQFAFYPKLSGAAAWWQFVPYAALLCAPLLMQAGEEIRWMK